jgi:hypothetical protein
MRAVLARVEDPISDPLIRYRTPRARAHAPYSPMPVNPIHLWYLNIVWLRSKLSYQMACSPPAATPESPLHAVAASAAFTNGSQDMFPSTDLHAQAEADAEAALDIVHSHTTAMLTADWRGHRKSSRAGESTAGLGQSLTIGLSTASGGMGDTQGTATITHARAAAAAANAAETELLLLACDSALAPAAALTHVAVRSFCGHLFLCTEHAPFEDVFSALLAGLRRAHGHVGDVGGMRGVRDAAMTLDLLSAAKKELASELVAFSEACTGLYAPPQRHSSVAVAAGPLAEAPFVTELLNAQQRVIGSTAVVFVGALARAFPAHMMLDDSAACLLDFSRIRPANRVTDDMVPLKSDAFGGLLRDWIPSSEGDSLRPTLNWSGRSSEQMFQSASPHAPGTPGSSFYSPRTTMNSELEAWATAASASAALDAGSRSTAAAQLVALHGGWHAAFRGPGFREGDALTVNAGCDGWPQMECYGRETEVAGIVSEVENGEGLVVVTGVHGMLLPSVAMGAWRGMLRLCSSLWGMLHANWLARGSSLPAHCQRRRNGLVLAGIGKTRVMQQATAQMLQSRTWFNTAYLRVTGSKPDASRMLCSLLNVPIPAFAPPEYTLARLAHCLAFGQRCGLIIDGIEHSSDLEALVEWSRKLRQHAPSIQVIFGVRLDLGSSLPLDLCHIRISPLRDAVADSMIQRAALLSVHLRLGLPPPSPPQAGSHSGFSGAPGLPQAGTTETLANGAAAPAESDLVPDLSQVIQPMLELAREGLRLCRGVPLLLHVLLQVALSCVLTPQSHNATEAFDNNLQVRPLPSLPLPLCMSKLQSIRLVTSGYSSTLNRRHAHHFADKQLVPHLI